MKRNFFIGFIMLLGFALVTMGAWALAQYSLPLPNPFPAYADIFPGQPASMAEARGFSCQRSYDYYDATEDHVPALEACIFAPLEGTFSSVQVIISDGIIRESIFLIRNNTLQVGNLERFLGMPALHTLHRTADFFLPRSFVIVQTVGYARQFSLFLPAWSISFTDETYLKFESSTCGNTILVKECGRKKPVLKLFCQTKWSSRHNLHRVITTKIG